MSKLEADGEQMSAQDNFRVDVRNEDRAVVFAVEGELDLASSPTLEQAIDSVSEDDIDLLIVDLRELRFMDSTGLHALVKANKRAGEAGRKFAVVQGGAQIQRLLSLTGVGELLTVAASPEELLRAD
jgi:anti-sigma B factor antagonist